jgi:hypothetical protein
MTEPDLFEPVSKCQHIWVEVGNRRWCVRRYDEGGCGAFEQRKRGTWVAERQGSGA